MRKAVGLLCVAVCLMAVSPAAAAAENRGSLRIDLEIGDLATTNGTMTLYQVGSREEEGYRIAEGFGGGIISMADADSDQLAMWLAESADEMGTGLFLDADGNAVFTDLEEGLYLLVQTERMDGFYPINPVLLTIPEADSWDVTVYREPVPVVTVLPKTGQSLAPFVGILGMILSSAGLLICAGKEKNSKKQGIRY